MTRLRKSKTIVATSAIFVLLAFASSGCAHHRRSMDDLTQRVSTLESRVDGVERRVGDAEARSRSAEETAQQALQRAQEAEARAEAMFRRTVTK
jgi:outer membrane murein-binding lipoprotein Lpp